MNNRHILTPMHSMFFCFFFPLALFLPLLPLLNFLACLHTFETPQHLAFWYLAFPPRAFQYQHVLRSLCMCMSLSVCVLMACGCMSTLCNAPPTGHLKGDRAQHKALHSCRWEQLMRLFECVIHSTWKRGDFTVFFFCCIRYSFW